MAGAGNTCLGPLPPPSIYAHTHTHTHRRVRSITQSARELAESVFPGQAMQRLGLDLLLPVHTPVGLGSHSALLEVDLGALPRSVTPQSSSLGSVGGAPLPSPGDVSTPWHGGTEPMGGDDGGYTPTASMPTAGGDAAVTFSESTAATMTRPSVSVSFTAAGVHDRGPTLRVDR